ncbi:SDR family oxidoreductase [Youngiibacter fragilis]|uniref:NmrA family transcriptional regulator n=1 Tax=Youngiibacter fragilis 232.1 TaxID=994573 RepID=V7I9R6_9CLOT|nr:SDR family oxidoreductase [Youngiibacter fragilis]ETA82079.1 NmrA family transcriptional regulator [Youngiibacter fragilis 232.1]
MKILVTGSSGNVGRHVVNELSRLGEEVVAAGTDVEKLGKMFDGGVSVAQFDFMRPETYSNALRDIDRVFLMRPPHLGKPEDIYPFIDSLKEHSIRLVSFLSLMGIEKNPIPPHHRIEKRIEASGIPFVHIRPGFFMQNITGLHLKEIRERDTIFIPAGESRTSLIDGSDVGLAAAAVLHEPERHMNSAYTITGPEAMDYYQAAKVLSDLTGRKITYGKPGILKYRNYCINERGLERKFANVTAALYLMTRMGTAEAVTDDFFRLTGRQPKTFADFVMENLKTFER